MKEGSLFLLKNNSPTPALPKGRETQRWILLWLEYFSDNINSQVLKEYAKLLLSYYYVTLSVVEVSLFQGNTYFDFAQYDISDRFLEMPFI